jgi:hypothetical protein
MLTQKKSINFIVKRLVAYIALFGFTVLIVEIIKLILI